MLILIIHIIDVDSVLGLLQHVVMGDVADIWRYCPFVREFRIDSGEILHTAFVRQELNG
jgi:hypothetical protein